MSLSCFIKLLAVAIAASFVGYYVVSAINPLSVPAASLFATGITLGTIFGGLLVALAPKASAPKPEKSETSNLYVGNLPFNAGMDDVKNLFSPFGEVVDVRLVKDRRSKRFKGYGFVEMDAAGALEAIKHLDGNDYAGRTLRVNEAKKKGEE
ncbi:MAG: RNA-binding protein [Mariprofundaceae bacterium]|nr:RNA-binding protein [Mariprofundaceae bacterium]